MIAVAGGKGGSGKTTTTVGLARALVRHSDVRNVVAADADWDLPNLAALAEATREADATAVTDANAEATSREPRTVVSAVADGTVRPSEGARTFARPAILAAPVHPEDHDAAVAFRRLDASVSNEPSARALLDCPAGVSPDAAAPLRAADSSVLVTSLDGPSLRDTAKTAAMARALDCPPLGTVVVRAESVPPGVSDLFGCPILGIVPDAPPAPLRASDVRSVYDDVARELVR